MICGHLERIFDAAIQIGFHKCHEMLKSIWVSFLIFDFIEILFSEDP